MELLFGQTARRIHLSATKSHFPTLSGCQALCKEQSDVILALEELLVSDSAKLPGGTRIHY